MMLVQDNTWRIPEIDKSTTTHMNQPPQVYLMIWSTVCLIAAIINTQDLIITHHPF